MADLSKLKPRLSKGTPPPPAQTNQNLSLPPREQPTQASDVPPPPPEKMGKIQFSAPEQLIDDFNMEAAHRFGFKKGSKSDLFIAMWELWKSSAEAQKTK